MEKLNIQWPGKAVCRSLIFIGLIVALTASGAWAQQAISFNIVELEVEGNSIAKESLIKSVAGLKKGDQLTATATQEAVTRLYHLGFFEDVILLAEEVTGGLKLIIRVKELPKLGTLNFKGNKEIKDKDFISDLKLNRKNYLSKNLIYEKRMEMIDMYGKKGYFYAEIDYKLDYNEDSTVANLTYKIKEGKKLKVEKVVLTGNVQIPAENIISKMRNRKRGLLKSSNFDKEKYNEDKEKVIAYLHKEGYIDAYLKSDSIAIDTVRSRMTVYFDIYEGPRYFFGKTDFTGNELYDDKLLSKVLKYKEGNVFDFEKFDESMYEIYFAYQERGYLHSRVIDDRKTKDSLIDITFDIIEGLPSEINFVKIIGNTKTREKVIRREMKVHPGQVFHRSLLIRSIRDIMALNYFGNAEPDIVDLPSGDIDVIIKIEEKPTAQVSAGAGYSGRDKFVGTFGLGIPNFRGMGQQLAINVDIGSNRDSYSLSFTEPWVFSTPTTVGGDLYVTNREWYSDYTEGRRGGSVRLGRRLQWPDNYFRVYARYRLEQDRFYDFGDSYSAINSFRSIDSLNYIDSVMIYPDENDSTYFEYLEVPIYGRAIRDIGDPLPTSLERFDEQWFSSSSLQLTLIRDSRDLPEFSTKGSNISYSFEYTGGFLGGYWHYSKHMLTAAKFIPLFWKAALASKITFGAVTSPGGDTKILEFDRFSPGGTGFTGVVRGYDDGSLTPDTLQTIQDTFYVYTQPVEEDGEPPTYDSIFVQSRSVGDDIYDRVRGKFMLVGNFELQIPLIPNQLYALAFFDIGNSWLNHEDIKFNDLYKGVGLGFRLVVPGIGTIGFDFGYALDEARDQEKGWHPHFQIGTVFR